jgi:hypothetical protein
MSDRIIRTEYVHVPTGNPIVISTGLGEKWSVYMVKPNGSLQRCKQFGQFLMAGTAGQELMNYKGKTIKRATE